MHLASAVFLDHRAVQCGAIPLVQIKAILGVLVVETAHEAVAGDFGDNGCRGNGRYFFISFNDGPLGNGGRQF